MSNWNGIDRRSHTGPTGPIGTTPSMQRAGLTGYEDSTTTRTIAELTGISLIADMIDDTWGYENYGRRKGDKK